MMSEQWQKSWNMSLVQESLNCVNISDHELHLEDSQAKTTSSLIKGSPSESYLLSDSMRRRGLSEKLQKDFRSFAVHFSSLLPSYC